MHKRISIIITIALAAALTGRAAAQTAPEQRHGGFVPGQRRPPGDPAQLARGKTLYGVNCAGCHGVDLRGGDMGGPNLLRSNVALTDQQGELILPIIQGSRQDAGMPPVPISHEDSLAVAAYIRSVVETIGAQGRPPSVGEAAPSILIGDAAAGQAYFTTRCARCHSVTGDLQGIGSRFSDPKWLQTRWVAAGAHRRFNAAASQRRTVTVTVALPSGPIEGRLVRIDDFLVSVAMDDGSIRTFARDGDTPKIEIHDPMAEHRELMTTYTDKDIHDVTAYLVTLK